MDQGSFTNSLCLLCIFVGFPRKPFLGSFLQLSSSLFDQSSVAFEA